MEVNTMDDKETQKEEGKSEENKESESQEEIGAEKTIAVLDRAEEINNVKSRNLKREEDLQTRKEEFAARQAVGGETEAGTESKPKFTDEEKASRARIKAVGDVTGSAWAKKYE